VGGVFQVFSWFPSLETPLTSLDTAFSLAGLEHFFISPISHKPETAGGMQQLRGMDGWQQHHAVPLRPGKVISCGGATEPYPLMREVSNQGIYGMSSYVGSGCLGLADVFCPILFSRQQN